MSDGARNPRISGLGGLLAMAWITLGVLGIARGATRYDMSDIVSGVAMCLLAPTALFLFGKTIPAAARRTWLFRLASTSATLGMVFAAVALVATVRDENPAAWFGSGRGTTAPDLLRNPVIYNNAPVHVHGLVVATDRGCALLVGNKTAGANIGIHPATRIWLGYRSNHCPITATVPVRASISGTFHAFRATRDRGAFYALESPIITGVRNVTVPRP